jgi:hypothetical protein
VIELVDVAGIGRQQLTEGLVVGDEFGDIGADALLDPEADIPAIGAGLVGKAGAMRLIESTEGRFPGPGVGEVNGGSGSPKASLTEGTAV